MRKTQHRGAEKAPQGHGHRDGKECVEPGCPEGPCVFEIAPRQGLEGALQRLHREGQTVDARSDDQPGERESQRVASEFNPPAADGALRSQQYQQVETKDRGRQDDWHRDQRLDHGFQASRHLR